MEERRDVGDGRGHRVEVGVEVLVDRRADHDHDVLGVGDHVGRARRPQPTRRQDRGQDLGCARLVEGHGARVHAGDRTLVHVVEHDVEATARERQPERETDVAAASDDGDGPLAVRVVHRAPTSAPLLRVPHMVEQVRRPTHRRSDSLVR